MKLSSAICKITRDSAHRAGNLAGLAFVLLFTTGIGFAQPKRDFSYRLQAVYLLNFIEFTEWPDSVFEDSRSAIVVGVLGTDPFAEILEEVVRDEIIADRSIKVVRLETVDNGTRCHAMFFCLSERENYSIHLKQLKGWPTLTVSEIDGFTYLGGCINFYVEEGKLRFEINMQALKESGIKMSSKLLRFARIVNPR